MQNIQGYAILSDVSFWINIVIGLFAFIGIFIIKSLKKNVEKLFERTEKHGEAISSIKKDVENHRSECLRNHEK